MSEILDLGTLAPTQRAPVWALVQAARKAAEAFRKYEAHHRAKDGDERKERAEVNRVLAEECEAALKQVIYLPTGVESPVNEASVQGPFLVPALDRVSQATAPVYVWWSWHPLYPYWSRSCWHADTEDAAVQLAERRDIKSGLSGYANKLVLESAGRCTVVRDVPCQRLDLWRQLAQDNAEEVAPYLAPSSATTVVHDEPEPMASMHNVFAPYDERYRNGA